MTNPPHHLSWWIIHPCIKSFLVRNTKILLILGSAVINIFWSKYSNHVLSNCAIQMLHPLGDSVCMQLYTDKAINLINRISLYLCTAIRSSFSIPSGLPPMFQVTSLDCSLCLAMLGNRLKISINKVGKYREVNRVVLYNFYKTIVCEYCIRITTDETQ